MQFPVESVTVKLMLDCVLPETTEFTTFTLN